MQVDKTGTKFVTVSEDHRLRVFRFSTGKLMRTYDESLEVRGGNSLGACRTSKRSYASPQTEGRQGGGWRCHAGRGTRTCAYVVRAKRACGTMAAACTALLALLARCTELLRAPLVVQAASELQRSKHEAFALEDIDFGR